MDEHKITDINPNDLEDVAILDGMGVIRTGYKLLDVDNKSNLARVIKNEKLFRVHPTRVIKRGQPGSLVVSHNGGAITTCPQCGAFANLGEDHQAKRIKCDKCQHAFDVRDPNTYLNMVGKRPIGCPPRQNKKTPQPKHQTKTVDLGALAMRGELWVKKDINFDHKHIKVATARLRIGDRYVSFNLYNMSYGKKGIEPPIDKLENGRESRKIYQIKSIEKWHSDLVSRGYSKYPTDEGAEIPRP